MRLLSQIGRRIDRPLSVSIQYVPNRPINSSVKQDVSEIIREEIERITELSRKLIEGEIKVF